MPEAWVAYFILFISPNYEILNIPELKLEINVPGNQILELMDLL